MKHLELENLLRQTEQADGQPFPADAVEKFSAYYALVLKWNVRLHLTTLVEPHAFLQRHLLEASWVTAQIEAEVGEVWDVGSGLGMPGVIVAILRPDLLVSLVEANLRKAVFLEEVVTRLGLANTRIVNMRFQDLPPLSATACLVSRALEKMEASSDLLLQLATGAKQILLLGNESLKRRVAQQTVGKWRLAEQILPDSDRRLLINLQRFH